jgi:hypothetical protein
LAGALLLGAGAAAAAPRCDTALVLALDASGSVDDGRWDLQREGTAAAVESALGRPGTVNAVAVVQWAASAAVGVGWTVVADAGSAAALAARIREMPRRLAGPTLVHAAVAASLALLDLAPCVAAREVVDVSGDGKDSAWIEPARRVNVPGPEGATPEEWRPAPDVMAAARAEAARRGATVNCLPIVAGEPDVAEWYALEVQAGEGSFTEAARGWEDFARAMARKLALETS